MLSLKTFLAENVMSPENDLTKEVESGKMLKKYSWYTYKSHVWKNNTLHIQFDRRGRLDYINEIAEKFDCKKFRFSPSVTLANCDILSNYNLKADQQLFIQSAIIRNCDLNATSLCSFLCTQKPIELKNTDITSYHVVFQSCLGVNDSNSKINANIVTFVDPDGKLKKVIDNIGIGRFKEKSWEPQWPISIDTKFDIIKELNMPSIKNVKTIAFWMTGSHLAVIFTKEPDKILQSDVMGSRELNNNWTVLYVKDIEQYK